MSSDYVACLHHMCSVKVSLPWFSSINMSCGQCINLLTNCVNHHTTREDEPRLHSVFPGCPSTTKNTELGFFINSRTFWHFTFFTLFAKLICDTNKCQNYMQNRPTFVLLLFFFKQVGLPLERGLFHHSWCPLSDRRRCCALFLLDSTLCTGLKHTHAHTHSNTHTLDLFGGNVPVFIF